MTKGDGILIRTVGMDGLESRARTGVGPDSRKPPTQGLVKWVDATCRGCGHEWTAGRWGPGSFAGMGVGEVTLKCPKCEEMAEVSLADVPGV